MSGITVSFHTLLSTYTKKSKAPSVRENFVFMIALAELCCSMSDLTGMVYVSSVPLLMWSNGTQKDKRKVFSYGKNKNPRAVHCGHSIYVELLTIRITFSS